MSAYLKKWVAVILCVLLAGAGCLSLRPTEAAEQPPPIGGQPQLPQFPSPIGGQPQPPQQQPPQPMAEQPQQQMMKQPWFQPAADLYADPAQTENPELFSRASLEALMSGVRGARIGPNCPLLLCAMHPLGLALITGGLLKPVGEAENLRLAETLLRMRESCGNRYRIEGPPEPPEQYYAQVEALCGILGIRASYQADPSQGNRRRIVLHLEQLHREVPLYSEVTGAASLIADVQRQCDCAPPPQSVGETPAPTPSRMHASLRPDAGPGLIDLFPTPTPTPSPLHASLRPDAGPGLMDLITPTPEPGTVYHGGPAGPLLPNEGWLDHP